MKVSNQLLNSVLNTVIRKGELQLQNTEQVVSQFILQNVQTDWQVNHESIRDEGFKSAVEFRFEHSDW